MEELQDAIEDAQYVNAIATQEDGPRPVVPWDEPTEEEFRHWKAKTKPDCLCEPICFFLFSQYVKNQIEPHENTNEEDREIFSPEGRQFSYVRMNFVEDVCRFKHAQTKSLLKRLFQYMQNYPTPGAASATSTSVHSQTSGLSSMDSTSDNIHKQNTTGNPPDLATTPPPPTEIVEYNLHRHTSVLGDASLSDYPHCSESFVGIRGEAREKILKIRDDFIGLQQHEEPGTDSGNDNDNRNSRRSPTRQVTNASFRQRSIRQMLHNETYIPHDTFDEAEHIVMASLIRDYWNNFTETPNSQYRKMIQFIWYQQRQVVPEDFYVMRVLGRGGFGVVNACKKGTSGKLYAMKVMSKRRIKMKKSELLTMNERNALAAVQSDFVVNLKYAFHSKNDVFLVLDLMTGGDLGYHLQQKGKFPKKECIYYAARIMLGLQALHDQKYVYRDLKPENCLLADDGRVKITDLGLTTKVTPTLCGAAGTRGYWAPEMLRRDMSGKRVPYGCTVDWFSFGCCLAEFISGVNPFRSERALNFGLERGRNSKEKAIDCATLEMQPEFSPNDFDPDAADLCRKLLEKDEKRRLGHAGCEEIMAHPYFKSLNWEYIITDRKRPPFIPLKDVNAASQSEIGNFKEDKAYQETVLTIEDERYYKNWDWTNPHAFAAEVIEVLIYERETGRPLVPLNHGSECCCTVL